MGMLTSERYTCSITDIVCGRHSAFSQSQGEAITWGFVKLINNLSKVISDLFVITKAGSQFSHCTEDHEAEDKEDGDNEKDLVYKSDDMISDEQVRHLFLI